MNVLYKKNLRRSFLLLLSLACVSHLATGSVFAASSAFTTIKTTSIVLNKKGSSITAQGTRPVIVKDSLKVTGNITLNAGKTVDGVDVGLLAATVAALQAGGGSVLGGTIESSEITDGTITTDDLADNSVGAAELANSAIQNGDIESADLPSLASTNLTDATAIGLLSENETITGDWVNVLNPWANDEVADSLTISGGSIDNSPIGATIASTGNFSNVTLNGVAPVLPALGSVPKANVNTFVDAIADNTGNGASVTIGVDGLPIISSVDVTNRDLKVTHCSNPECTSSTTTTPSTDGRLASAIIIGADGFPVIVYDRISSDGIMVLKCGDATCSSGNTTSLIEAVGIIYASVTIGTDGLPIISYNVSSGSDLKVAKCGDAACSTGNTITTIDADSVVSFSPPSIAIAPDGLPVIAYHYYSGGFDLKVAKCTTASCSSSGIQTVDSTNNVGLYSSLVIGNDGLPVISYYDDSNDNLMIAKCGDATCTNGAATITTVDNSPGNVGSGNSITIGPDGFPIVAYMDETNGYIKLLKCSTLSCATGNTITSPINLNTTSFSMVHIVSLTLGRNNLPFIAYYHQSTLDLNTAALGNIFGSDYFVRR